MEPLIDWQRVYQALTRLLDTPEPDRDAKLEELCGDDTPLKRAVRTALLEAEATSTHIGFEKPVQEMLNHMVSESEHIAPSRSSKKVNHYYIQNIIGQGGQGDVYRAWDERLERNVAIKFLSNRHAVSEQVLEQFQREARAIASVEDPHVCRLYSFETGEQGAPFMVMEYVDGMSLAEKISRDGPMPLTEALEIVRQICRGLRAAHDKKLIHQDIKPSNILLAGSSKIKIADFGVAKWARLHSQSGGAGTLPYMSPEQLRNEPIDYRTDIWSLGVLMYELLDGRNPLRQPDMTLESCAAIVHGGTPFPPLTTVPEDIANVLSRCLETDREKRFRSISELESHLPPRDSEPSDRKSRKRYRYIAAFSAAVLLFLAYYFTIPVSAPNNSSESIALMWSAGDQDPFVREWVNFQLEASLSRMQLDSTGNYPGISIVEPAKEVSTPEGVFNQYNPYQIVQLSIIPLEGGNTLRIRLIDSADPRSSLRNVSLPLQQLSYSTAHLLLVKLLELLDIRLSDREVYLILYNSSADPEAIRLFESAQALLESAGGITDIDRAVDLLRTSIQVDSSFALSYAWLAQAYLERSVFNESLLDLQRAQWADSMSNVLDRGSVLRYTNFVSQGLIHKTTGHLDEATAAFDKAIALDPTQYIAYIGAAEALALQGRPAAETYFHRALSLDANDTEVLIALGVYKFHQSEYDSAAYYFNRIIELDSNYKAAHRNLGACYAEMNQIGAAIESYNRALAIEPDYLNYHNLAVIYYQNEEYDRAISEWREAIQLNPGIHYLWAGLGFTYKHYADSSQAQIRAFLRAVEIAETLLGSNPHDVSVLLALSDYHLQLHDSTKSRYFLREADKLPIPTQEQDNFEQLSSQLNE